MVSFTRHDSSTARDAAGQVLARAQVFECVLGVALKTLTNFCNHLAHAEPNPEFVAMAHLE